MKLKKTKEFNKWHSSLGLPFKQLVDARLLRIQEHEHFGDAKMLTKKLAELRWKNGIRVYFAKEDDETIILILGGLKNAQKKDIKKAKLLLQRYVA